MSEWREHVYRWVFSPYDAQEKPRAAAFCLEWNMPHPLNGHALVYCRMTRGQLVQAQKDEQLIVLAPLHRWHEPADGAVVKHHADMGVKSDATMAELLEHMSQFHPYFEPTH